MKDSTNLFSQNSYLDFCKEILENKDFKNDYELIYKIGVLCDLFFIANDNFEIKENIKEELEKEIQNIDNSIIKRLIETAFIFANLNSNNETEEEKILEIDKIKNQAYRIAVSIYYYGKYVKNFSKNNSFFENNTIIYQLFTRLGILSKPRNEILEDVDIFSLNFSLKIEAVQKEINNKFSIGELFETEKLKNIFANFSKFQNDEVYFSDFQKQIIDKLIGYKGQDGKFHGTSQIISAPTSAGKTFIIKKYIIFKIIESLIFGNKINIAFVVPSKALINEIQADFINIFQDYFLGDKDIFIHSNLSHDDFKEKFYYETNLFIFTPERLNYFYEDLRSGGIKLKIDILIIDEAHKVGYGYRGTLLQYIGKQIQKTNKNAQIILLAPLLKKLHKFKEEFLLESINIEENFSYFTPVAKNEIFVNFNTNGENNFYHTDYEIKIDDKKIFLFSYKYGLENFAKNKKGKINPNDKTNSNILLAIISRFFTTNSAQSIIFRFGMESTKNQIELIQKGLKNNNSKQNTEIGNYISETLPKNFNIESLINNGLAYHNAGLPSSIRTIVENLFKEGKLQFLAANNTVLEGVNLPAKNIFVHKEDYLEKSLNYFDKKNLIGRTGRLNEHLSGNIFYVKFQEEDINEIINEEGLEELEFNISDALDDIIEDQDLKTKFDRYLEYIGPGDKWRKVHQYTGKTDNNRFTYQELKDFEYMTGYLISCKLEDSKVIFSEKVKSYIYEKGKEREDKLEKLDNYLQTIYIDIISKNDEEFQKILQKNIFIEPRKQIRFYEKIVDGENKFIIENIGKYSNILKNLLDNVYMKDDNKKYGELQNIEKSHDGINQIKELVKNMQEYFIPKFQHTKKDGIISNVFFYGNSIFYQQEEKEWHNQVLQILTSWLYSHSIKNIIGDRGNAFKKLKIITQQIQFEYINALTAYFELANLGYKKYCESNGIDYNDEKLDENFIYYMELGSFYPNFVFLINKGVSRESAILMGNKKIIDKFPKNKNSSLYFKENKEKIFYELEKNKLKIIIEELKTFIYK